MHVCLANWGACTASWASAHSSAGSSRPGCGFHGVVGPEPAARRWRGRHRAAREAVVKPALAGCCFAVRERGGLNGIGHSEVDCCVFSKVEARAARSTGREPDPAEQCSRGRCRASACGTALARSSSSRAPRSSAREAVVGLGPASSACEAVVGLGPAEQRSRGRCCRAGARGAALASPSSGQ